MWWNVALAICIVAIASPGSDIFESALAVMLRGSSSVTEIWSQEIGITIYIASYMLIASLV